METREYYRMVSKPVMADCVDCGVPDAARGEAIFVQMPGEPTKLGAFVTQCNKCRHWRFERYEHIPDNLVAIWKAAFR